MPKGMQLNKSRRHPRSPAKFIFVRMIFLFIVCLVAVMVSNTTAFAAEGHPAGPSEGLLLTQIVILVLAGRLLGELMIKFRQPAIMGQLLAGIMLGPSVLGLVSPSVQQSLFPPDPTQKALLNGIAQFGILMLLLLAGMETDLALVRRVRRAAFSTSVTGIVIPFLCGFALGELLPTSLLPDPTHRLLTSLFLGTALSISSVKIVAAVIRDLGFLRHDIGQIILATAIVDDTIGWVIIALTLSLAAHASLDWWSLTQTAIGTGGFLFLSFTYGQYAVFRLIQLSNDNGRGEAPVIAMIILIMSVMALTTNAIGVHTVLGAFVAGILVGDSPLFTEKIEEELRGITAGLFMPVFFGLAGLSSDVTILANSKLALLTLAFILIASLGKSMGAFVGGLAGGLTVRQCLAVAAGMNARGSTEIIVASIGLSMGLLTKTLFTIIVAMAFITTVAMPPTLRWALGRLPLDEDERKRLELEKFDTQGFLSGLRRILAVVDDSRSGALAAQIVTLVAGKKGVPVTFLGAQPPADENTKLAAIITGKGEGGKLIDFVERNPEVPLEEAVTLEEQKGYDLLVVGLDGAVDEEGNFTNQLSVIAKHFQGSLAIVLARGIHEKDDSEGIGKILVPVTGSEVSRFGAEMALTLGKAATVPVSVITVISPEGKMPRKRIGTVMEDARQTAKEIREFAKAAEQPVKIIQRTNLSSEDAIISEAARDNHDLIMLGVSRRPGSKLSFGKLAAGLLESSDRSLVLYAPTNLTKKKPN